MSRVEPPKDLGIKRKQVPKTKAISLDFRLELEKRQVT